jgi:hypothetical protein
MYERMTRGEKAMALLLIISGIVVCALAIWLAMSAKGEEGARLRPLRHERNESISIRETTTLHGAVTVEGEVVD